MGPTTTSTPVRCRTADWSLNRLAAAASCGVEAAVPSWSTRLHKMDGAGQPIRTLSFHETHEWHPSLLNDGRVIYTRWDYVDRNAAKFHGLWTCNQDGSNPSILFGNYTTRPWACYQAKADSRLQQDRVRGRWPSRERGWHADAARSRSTLRLDPQRGEDRFEALTCLTPEVGFRRSGGMAQELLLQPLAPFREVLLRGLQSRSACRAATRASIANTETGIYYFDVFGNLELLYRQPGISAVYPIPLARAYSTGRAIADHARHRTRRGGR